jgi:hypothetical protein
VSAKLKAEKAEKAAAAAVSTARWTALSQPNSEAATAGQRVLSNYTKNTERWKMCLFLNALIV